MQTTLNPNELVCQSLHALLSVRLNDDTSLLDELLDVLNKASIKLANDPSFR